jgi:hypothetical protein
MMCATVLPLKSGQGGIYAVAHTPASPFDQTLISKFYFYLVRNDLSLVALCE